MIGYCFKSDNEVCIITDIVNGTDLERFLKDYRPNKKLQVRLLWRIKVGSNKELDKDSFANCKSIRIYSSKRYTSFTLKKFLIEMYRDHASRFKTE